MTDEIERLKQQHKEELDLAQEVIVNLRRDLAHAHKWIHSQDAVWNDAVQACVSEVKEIGMRRHENAETAIEAVERLVTIMRPMI